MMKRLLLASLLAPVTLPARAEDDAFAPFDEGAQVVTASRRPEALVDAPVTIDVITAEEIRASGASSFADLLRFRVGMDVIDGRTGVGNTMIMSVRGLPQEFAHNLQVLVDGRSVYSAMHGGVVWSELPVQLQDVARIEIVRGPNAALYGSNAGQGVINIITRSPKPAPAGGRAEVRAGTRRTANSAVAVEGGGLLAYRFSHSYEYSDGLSATRASRNEGSILSNKAAFHGVWKPRPGLILDVWTAGSDSAIGVPNGQRAGYREHYEATRLASDPVESSSWEASASRKDVVSVLDPNPAGRITLRELQYDAEFLHRLRLFDGRLLHAWGLSYRQTTAQSDQFFAGSPDQYDHLWREFLNEALKVSDELTLSGGVSLEQSPLNGRQQNYQAALQYAPSRRHGVRASWARATANIPFFMQGANLILSPGVTLRGNPDLTPGHQTAYELGYRGRYLEGSLDVETNVFYMKLDGLDFGYAKSFTPFPFKLVNSIDNRNSAIARGLEAQLKYRLDASRSLFANYTYETVADAKNDPSVAGVTPLHKLNLGAMGALGRGFGLYAVAGYKDHYVAKSLSALEATARNIPAYWRLDARLSYAAAKNVELFGGGRNLLISTHREFADTLEVPRVFYGGVSVAFGGVK